jgi:GNAT superfamily N-acetyltransferase
LQRSDRPVRIVRLYDLPLPDIQPLMLESRTEHHRFVDRLVDEYVSGSNRFALPGEALYATYAGDTMVGVGGLNRDPYVNPDDTGRVRHLYVLPGWRGRGVGRRLMQQIVDEASDNFSMLTLRTFSPDASQFYVTIGFEPVSDIETVTHRLLLER